MRTPCLALAALLFVVPPALAQTTWELIDEYPATAIPGEADAFFAQEGATRTQGAPINIPGSRFLRPYDPRLRQFDELRIHRMIDEMTDAAEAGQIYHLWWHPHNFGTHANDNFAILSYNFV